MNLIIIVLEQSFLLMPLILGVYLSYAILKVTDVSVDGTFVLGAAMSAKLIADYGLHPVLVIAISLIAGLLVGIALSIIQKHDKIDPLITGIIMVFMLYSINLQVMEKPNINLYSKHLLTDIIYSPLLLNTLIMLLPLMGILYLLQSRTGLLLRAFGENKSLLQKLNLNAENYRMIGLSISSALAAFCGSMHAQIYTYADVNMGFGMALTGISAVIIGMHCIHFIFPNVENFSAPLGIAACLLGAIIYFLLINALLTLGINPINLKLILGVILIFFLRSSIR